MKITPADKNFSWCIRERAGWTCERCGRQYTPPTTALHCSHYIGRGNWSTRFEPDNAFAHCYGCHSLFEGDPYLFTECVKETIGVERFDILIEKKENPMIGKQMRHEVKEIAKHYKDELITMQQKRYSGNIDRLEFVAY